MQWGNWSVKLTNSSKRETITLPIAFTTTSFKCITNTNNSSGMATAHATPKSIQSVELYALGYGQNYIDTVDWLVLGI